MKKIDTSLDGSNVAAVQRCSPKKKKKIVRKKNRSKPAFDTKI